MNTETMELNLSHLSELLRMSKSLVFVPDRATAKVVRKTCHALGLPCYLVEPMNSHYVHHFERDKENFTTIASPDSVDYIWSSCAEQVVLVGMPDRGDCANQRMTKNRVIYHVENWGTP
jgi:hypothetical protein